MNEEWLSAHLDGELTPEEAARVDEALASDPELAALHDELRAVRASLRGAVVAVADRRLAQLVAAVEATPDAEPSAPTEASVVPLAPRRRARRVVAVAAVVVIIAGVVGGVGGTASLPALGDLVARHEAAAAVVTGEPATGADPLMDEMDPMPMDEAADAALPMPGEFAMEKAFADGTTVHLVYRSRGGETLSVFRHEGDVDVEDLGDGSTAWSDEAAMWSAPMEGSYVAVVDGDGYVWVVVSAGPHPEMMDDMMHDLPSRSPSWRERLARVVEPLRFWD